MAKVDPLLAKMREICLSLPDTKETPTWGTPHFRVGEKIFSGYGQENGKASTSFKLEMAHSKSIVKDPRFSPAPYVGHKGWVSMDLNQVKDWEEVRALVQESYRLIAPKKSLAKFGGTSASPKKAPTTRSAAAKKSVAKKSTARKAAPKKGTSKKAAKVRVSK